MSSTGALPAAALMAAAVALLLTRPRPARRLLALRPPAPVEPPVGISSSAARAACLLAGVAGWALLGGALGIVVATAFVLLGPRGIARLSAVSDDDAEVARDLPLALDLLAACLVGGALTSDALIAVAAALPGPCGDRLATVAARLALGSAAADAWLSLGQDRGPAGAAARAMSRAAVGGAPVAAAVQRVADDARRDARAAAERGARRAGVLVVGPLGLCFLPAFLLIGVVPAVIGLAGPVLSTL